MRIRVRLFTAAVAPSPGRLVVHVVGAFPGSDRVLEKFKQDFYDRAPVHKHGEDISFETCGAPASAEDLVPLGIVYYDGGDTLPVMGDLGGTWYQVTGCAVVLVANPGQVTDTRISFSPEYYQSFVQHYSLTTFPARPFLWAVRCLDWCMTPPERRDGYATVTAAGIRAAVGNFLASREAISNEIDALEESEVGGRNIEGWIRAFRRGDATSPALHARIVKHYTEILGRIAEIRAREDMVVPTALEPLYEHLNTLRRNPPYPTPGSASVAADE